MRLNNKKRSGKGQKVVNEKTVLRIFCLFESLDLNRIEEKGVTQNPWKFESSSTERKSIVVQTI